MIKSELAMGSSTAGEIAITVVTMWGKWKSRGPFDVPL